MYLAKALLSMLRGTGSKSMHAMISFLRIRFAESSKGGRLLRLITPEAWDLKVSKVPAVDSKDAKSVDTTDHRLLLESKDLDSESGFSCHSDENEGNFVHTVLKLKMGSHRAISRNSRTVTLCATGGALSAKYHAISANPVFHPPHKVGLWVVCPVTRGQRAGGWL